MKEPKIRFKGFQGEWETKNIASVASLKAGVSIDTSKEISYQIQGYYPCYGGNGLRGYVSDYTHDGIYNIIGRQGALCGNVRMATGKFHATEHAVVVTPIKKLNPYFLFNVLTKANINQYATGVAQPGLSVQNVNKRLYINIPNFDEQQSIATYFQYLDSLIQSTTKKIESLKQVKAASLQSMFPQEGETTPRVRFKGFEGEWEKVQFSELYEPSSIKNKTFGADKIISVANMYFKPVSYISDEEYLKSYNVMNLGDIAFEGNKSKDYAHGRFVENTIGDGIVSHVFIVLKPISKQYDLQFWKYLINYERIMGPILLRSTKHSTMMTDLVVSDFLKESVLVPSYEEQIEIGKILSSLDRQITLHTQRLEKLKQIKAACLDEMFV